MNDQVPNPQQFHRPVLLDQVLSFASLAPGYRVLDATLGSAGHSEPMARQIAPDGLLIALDRDVMALTAAEVRLGPLRSMVRIETRHTAFANLYSIVQEVCGPGHPQLNVCLFDVGVSNFQLDTATGFSFRRDEYLDGRMNRTGNEPTIAQIIAETDEAEITRILTEYGEEPFARKISRRIAEYKASGKSIDTTGQLVELVEQSVPRAAYPRDKHVATRVFQAFRVRCNNELGQLEVGINAAIDCLAPGGRVLCITFQSLEDRLVKSIFLKRAGLEPAPSGMSMAALAQPSGKAPPEIKIITRKPVTADAHELQVNHRARSAKLRVAERIGE